MVVLKQFQPDFNIRFVNIDHKTIKKLLIEKISF